MKLCKKCSIKLVKEEHEAGECFTCIEKEFKRMTTRLEYLENKILYKHFRKENPDLLISHIAEDYLVGTEYKEYLALLKEV